MSEEDSKPCKHCGKTMHKKPSGNAKIVTDFNWVRRMFCNHKCRSAFTNERYREETNRLLSVKKECVVCHEEKPLYAYKIKAGVRVRTCKKCESELKHGKIQWRTLEDREMKIVKRLRETMAGLNISHSSMPDSLEPFIGLKVYLDQ